MNPNSTGILTVNHIREEKTSTDGRNYKTAYFQPQAPKGILSNAKPRGRVLWAEGPNGSAGDAMYDQIKVGSKVLGTIESIDVEPYYIPSEYGKDADPETGEAANRVTRFTSVVFEDENIYSLARSRDLTPLGESAEEQVAEETIEEELVAE